MLNDLDGSLDTCNFSFSGQSIKPDLSFWKGPTLAADASSFVPQKYRAYHVAKPFC